MEKTTVQSSSAPSSHKLSTRVTATSKSVEDLDTCVTPATVNKPKGNKQKAGFRIWFLEHQLLFSLTGSFAIILLHNLSSPFQKHAGPFIRLSYFNPSRGTFGRGADDAYFVAMSVLLFTAVRAVCVEYLFKPFAASRGLKPKAAVRFAEQGWQFVYYFTYWSFGMYLWTTSRYWLEFSEIWSDWPVRETPASTKIYTLSQMAFWFQQILVLNMEEKRKDYYQMLFHHIITTTLLLSAYVYGFFNVANVVLCLMDVVDLLLPGAKMLKYLGYENACNAVFATFFVAWLIPRHVIYNMLVWSIYKEVPSVMPYGCHSATGDLFPPSPSLSNFTSAAQNPEIIDNWSHMLYPFQDISGTICMSPRIKMTFVLFLAFLQILSLIWLGMIVGVLLKMLVEGKPAEDTRSDEEDGNVDVSEEEVSKKQPPAVASNGAGSNQIKGSNGGKAYTKKMADSSHSSSVLVQGSNGTSGGCAGHVRTFRGPKKELLGRIGCEKPTNN